METKMITLQEKLGNIELDIQNLTMFISQSLEKLQCKMCEYNHLQRELYIQDGLEKANIYANYEG